MHGKKDKKWNFSVDFLADIAHFDSTEAIFGPQAENRPQK